MSEHILEVEKHQVWADMIRMAYRHAAEFSQDPDVHTGAVLVDIHGSMVGKGANRFLDGVAVTPERLQRPLIRDYLQHAEADAILSAAKSGFYVKGSTLFAPWFACKGLCMRVIAGSGVSRVVGHHEARLKTPPHWKADIDFADSVLDEAGVERIYLTGVIGGCQSKMHDGVWNP